MYKKKPKPHTYQKDEFQLSLIKAYEMRHLKITLFILLN